MPVLYILYYILVHILLSLNHPDISIVSRQAVYCNVTLRRVRVGITAVGKQLVLNIISIFL